VPNKVVRTLTGKKGAKLQQIKKQCGGSVTVVFVDRADSTEAVAKITGPASAVLKAKSKIEQAIASSSESSQSENCDEEPDKPAASADGG